MVWRPTKSNINFRFWTHTRQTCSSTVPILWRRCIARPEGTEDSTVCAIICRTPHGAPVSPHSPGKNVIIDIIKGQLQRSCLNGRLLPPAYDDGISEPRTGYGGYPLPGARSITSVVHVEEGFSDHAATTLVVSWGQFMDHDFTLTGTMLSTLSTLPCFLLFWFFKYYLAILMHDRSAEPQRIRRVLPTTSRLPTQQVLLQHWRATQRRVFLTIRRTMYRLCPRIPGRPSRLPIG